MINFLDNNFSDDRAHMLAVAELLGSHPKVRGWSALVTQNVLHDRELIRTLARLKCMVLFAGLESLDHEMLRRFNKTQNMSRRFSVIDDIAFAESLGVAICYGYLFDYCHQTAAEMERQILAIARNPLMPMPVYLSVVAPLAGTASFWDDLRRGHLAPNLRLRDLDGETICHSNLADRPEAIVSFIERMFRRPWTVVPRAGILLKTLRRLVRARSLNPVRWYVIASANFHCFIWSSETPSQARTYVAGDRHPRSTVLRAPRGPVGSRSDPLFRPDPADRREWAARRVAAARTFRRPECRPTSPWISPATPAARRSAVPEPASDEDLVAFMRWLHTQSRRETPWPRFDDPARRDLVPLEFWEKLPAITLRIVMDLMKRPAPPGLSERAGGGAPRTRRAGPKRGRPQKPARKPSARKPAARRRRRRAG